MKLAVLAVLGILCVAGCNPTSSSVSSNVPAANKDRDNSGVNVRDRDNNAKTPIDQNENSKDIDITAKIRKLVVGTNMSTNAHNVKIITQDGRVTLRGPVKLEEEKTQIAKFAEAVAGKGQVDNQIEVETSP